MLADYIPDLQHDDLVSLRCKESVVESDDASRIPIDDTSAIFARNQPHPAAYRQEDRLAARWPKVSKRAPAWLAMEGPIIHQQLELAVRRGTRRAAT